MRIPAMVVVVVGLVAPATADEFARCFQRAAIVDAMQRVRRYQLAHPWRETDRNWIRATYYTGIMGLYRATNDPEVLRQAEQWAEKHGWTEGNETEPANRKTCGQTYLELYFIKPEPKRIRRIRAYVDQRMAKIAAGESPLKGWYYCDTLYVGPPTIAMLGKATGEHKYYGYLNRVYWAVVDRLYDRSAHLFYRDASYIGARSRNGKRVFWSRGNGWVIGGIPRVLEYLPRENPAYGRYVRLFREMAAAIAPRQGEDGLWRANLDDPDEYPNPETSGTAFFCYALAWGINHGLLDRDAYLPVVMRAWQGLMRHVSPEGKLGYVQPVGAAPAPADREQTHEYAMGLFMLAGEQVLKLVDARLIDERAIEALRRTLQPLRDPTSPIVPPRTWEQRNPHPYQEVIDAFLRRARSWSSFKPTGLTRADYLDVIARQVAAMRKYQNAEGRIIDPVEGREAYYATPCYAHCVAALAAARHGCGPDLLESGMKAMDAATSDMAAGKTANRHGDFFTWPVMLAYDLYRDTAPKERREQWRRRLKSVTPEKLYQARNANNNWNVVNLSGEYLRSRAGRTGTDYVELFLGRQLRHFTAAGMYNEHGNPLPYDLFPRHYLSGMLQLGYRGELYATYRKILWRGAWMSLLMQSPTGELPTGYRSSHHIWNEAEEAVVFEIYARHCALAGRRDEAGAMKRAAHLALQSIRRWLRPDGSGYIVKNRYPIEARHGYESYSAHTTYNLLACSMLAQAWQFADDSIQERPAPADIGGYVVPVIDPFHKVFASAGGTYIEYDTAGDHIYNPTGLIRIHLRDGHSQLGPSDGCAARFSGPGMQFAVGPEWKDQRGWHRLAAADPARPAVDVLQAEPERVRLRVRLQASRHRLPQRVAGRRGGAWQFGHPAARVVAARAVRFAPSAPDEYTIALWFQRDRRDTRSALFSGTIQGEHAWYLELSEPGRLRFVHRVPPGGQGGTELIASLPPDSLLKWHHVAAVRRGKQLQLYVDGRPVAAAEDPHPLRGVIDVHLANLHAEAGDRHFFGRLDDVRIYGRALQGHAIKELAEGRSLDQGLLAHWPCDAPPEGDDWTVVETITVEPQRVTVEDEVQGEHIQAIRVHFPMLVYDGLRATQVKLAGNQIQLELDGRGVQVAVERPGGAVWKRTTGRLNHRNGQVVIATAESEGNRAVYQIEPLKSTVARSNSP